jgi:hypothetical protein
MSQEHHPDCLTRIAPIVERLTKEVDKAAVTKSRRVLVNAPRLLQYRAVCVAPVGHKTPHSPVRFYIEAVAGQQAELVLPICGELICFNGDPSNPYGHFSSEFKSNTSEADHLRVCIEILEDISGLRTKRQIETLKTILSKLENEKH